MNLKPVYNWFKTSFDRFETSFILGSKNVNFKNLFFMVATFWATFGKRLATFVSTFLAALPESKENCEIKKERRGPSNWRKLHFCFLNKFFSFKGPLQRPSSQEALSV